jgi:hypothetical protein
MQLPSASIRFLAGGLRLLLRRPSTLGLLCIVLVSVGSRAAEVSPPGPATNTVAHLAAVESSAPVPVPEPSAKAIQYYRSGIGWWLLSVGWSWLVPALILFSGFSGWLGRQAKRIGRWEVSATFVFVLLYLLVDYVLCFPLSYWRDFVREHHYDLSNQSFAR